MLISLNWLNEYIDIKDKSIQELEYALTMIGQEVEKIENKYEHLSKVLTAKIVGYEKMPDSDHLTVCQVDNGTQVLQVVCGASNHKLNDIVAMAQVGAKLSKDFEIKKSKIRSYESNGMLCSMKELSLSEESDGIIILPQDTKLGLPLNEYFGKYDVVFELEITPNRPDCLSYLGIAKELSAYYNIPLKKLDITDEKIEGESDLKLNIENEDICDRYALRVIEDIEIKESPKWLKEKLESMGLHSINNIVDISNFTMFEQNQPNHIFDYDKLKNDVTVRLAKNGEKVLTLDDKDLELCDEDIVITSNGKVVGLAGVMGAKEYSIDQNTKNIAIEVANFNPTNIRKTSRKYAIFSDSSYRFERGIQKSNVLEVMQRITNLVKKENENAKVYSVKDIYLKEDEIVKSELNLDRMYKFIGKNIGDDETLSIFERLGIKVEKIDDRNLLLTPPAARLDLKDEQDYYEEIIRMYGFDNIENILPKLDIKSNKIIDTTELNYEIKNICASLGLNEVINYSFIPKKGLSDIKYEEEEKLIDIENPITEDFAVMRPSLIFSLLKNAKDNFNRSFNEVRFFEVSKTFEKADKINENTKLAIILSGNISKNIYENAKQYDFYDIKGIFEAIFEKLKINSYRLLRTENGAYHPKRAVDVYVGKELLGTFGQIHPDLEENFDIEKKSTMLLELDIDKMKKFIKKSFNYSKISKYQSTTRDLAFVVKEDVLVGQVIKSVEKIDKIIKKVSLFDVYKGPGVEQGYKSFAISMLLCDDDKTMQDSQINEVVEKIKNKVIKEFDAVIRM